MIWTEEQVAEVKRLAREEGLSARQIAGRVGSTRNAIIGLTRRNDIALGFIKGKPPQPVKTGPVFTAEKVVAKPDVPPPGAKLIDFMKITSRTCKWPFGDPGEGLKFCGCAKTYDKPYCEFHMRKAYAAQRVAP